MDRPETHHRWRLMLAVTGLGVPLFGLLHALELAPEPLTTSGMRVAISTSAWLAIAASYVHTGVRLRLRSICLGLACWVQGFFICVGAAEGMGEGRLIGILLISALTALMFRSAAEVCAFAIFTALVGIASYNGVEAPEVRLGLFLGTMITAIVGVGGISVSRNQLEQALLQASAELERRVLDRTAELAASLHRLEREVEERKAAEQQAQEASQAKSTFLANMSHELRTPLNAIVGYTEMVAEELGDTALAHLTEDLGRVRTSAGHLLRLIDDVLDLTRIEAGKLELHPKPVEVGPLVSEVIAALDRSQPRNGNTLTVDIPRQLSFCSDPRLLRQLLLNLLSNALKFTTDGQVQVVARQVGSGLSLSVSDTGIGIPPAATGRIFQKFAQVDDSPTRRHGGTGLGLALCRELVARHGGTLSVRSELGVGSTFTAVLPPLSAN